MLRSLMKNQRIPLMLVLEWPQANTPTTSPLIPVMILWCYTTWTLTHAMALQHDICHYYWAIASNMEWCRNLRKYVNVSCKIFNWLLLKIAMTIVQWNLRSAGLGVGSSYWRGGGCQDMPLATMYRAVRIADGQWWTRCGSHGGIW